MTYLDIDDPARRLTLDELKAMPGTEIPLDAPHRIDVDLGDTLIPLLVVRRAETERLVVLNNGAVDLERSNREPVFQRSSWWADIAAHQIYVCDPGTVGDSALALNWLQTRRPRWVVRDIVKAVILLSRSLGVTRPELRTYYGSSAGGFAALLQLAYDRRARAIVNNPQIDWTRWHAHQVRPVLKSYFTDLNAAEVRSKFAKRANCLQNLADTGTRARIEYWVNMASDHDRDVQLPISFGFMQGNPSICENISIHLYFDDHQGHNPLAKSKTVHLLNRD